MSVITGASLRRIARHLAHPALATIMVCVGVTTITVAVAPVFSEWVLPGVWTILKHAWSRFQYGDRGRDRVARPRYPRASSPRHHDSRELRREVRRVRLEQLRAYFDSLDDERIRLLQSLIGVEGTDTLRDLLKRYTGARAITPAEAERIKDALRSPAPHRSWAMEREATLLRRSRRPRNIGREPTLHSDPSPASAPVLHASPAPAASPATGSVAPLGSSPALHHHSAFHESSARINF